MKLEITCMAFIAFGFASGQAAAQAQQPTQSGQPTEIPAQAQQQADAAFAAWDTDRSNGLSQQEFRNGWFNLQRSIAAQALRAQFDRVDANNNGAIDADEYRNLVLVQRAGSSAPPLASFDANKDQRLQFQEYAALVQRLAAGN